MLLFCFDLSVNEHMKRLVIPSGIQFVHHESKCHFKFKHCNKQPALHDDSAAVKDISRTEQSENWNSFFENKS